MKLSSFDIFDTCLVRKCGDANAVFDIVAERAFSGQVSSEAKRAFVAARIEAANKTWSDSQKLTDIYEALEYEHPNLLLVSELVSIEMDVEREMLCPVYGIANLLTTLRKAGHRIMFISDMYLSEEFLLSVLQETGLWKDGDTLYVSCELGLTKASGKLFEYIHEKENIPYKRWEHYGDHLHSDAKMPNQLGIHAHAVLHRYTPYQQKMRQLPSLHYQWGSILAGISRSICVQSEQSAHKDFVLDVIAPLYASFVYRVMADAQNRGIQSLYFCARDAYPLYRIATRMQSLFPMIAVHYLFISRTSLYSGEDNDKMGYFKQIGMASKTAENAIVDIRTSGKTLRVLNELLVRNNCKSIFGYFFELGSENVAGRPSNYYTELDDQYIQQMSHSLRKLPSNWYMYELFFPLNTQKRTVGYQFDGKEYVPILEKEDNKEYRMDNLQECVEWRNNAMDAYTDRFIQLGLHVYAGEIFTQYAIPQLADFFQYPQKHYLEALSNFYGLHPDKGFIPYVDKSLFRLPLNILKHRTMWKRGTIFYALPTWLSRYLYKNR